MKHLLIIDGQGGRLGSLLVEAIRKEAFSEPLELLAVGTNAVATGAMLKAGADRGATGENPVLVACRTAEIILGPIGIVVADAMLGEITPAMAAAVGQSTADKILLPISHCRNHLVGIREASMSELVAEAMTKLRTFLR